MGELVPFKRAAEKKMGPEDDFTKILKDVVEIRRESPGAEVNGIFQMNGSFEDLLKAKIGSFIIENKLITADLFRCSLYVSHLLGETLSKRFDSYYAVDYLIRGYEEGPAVLQQGADLCCVFCILFEERATWRMMKQGDYVRMGIQLYSLYYSRTKRVIGWCMSRNFESIISIAKKCIEDMEKGE
ncbi:MAG: hypothetical protein K8I29_06820 [Alphaproteobacteria bacterium]|uniref:Uncharacterized protein n=1 Tax=Candidatus Nitrobium versatile TaxID=2884831 RepID=A0A953M1M9_9BACT|nr:hypothetical protein [Candidatus Nitrobium versatile]